MVLTKGDLLSVEELAASLALVKNDLEKHMESWTSESSSGQPTESSAVGACPAIHPISCNTGAGINAMWKHVLGLVDSHAVPLHDVSVSPYAVREHKDAGIIRRQNRAQLKPVG